MKPRFSLSRRDFVKSASSVAIVAGAYPSIARSLEKGSTTDAMIPTARGDTVAASKLGMVLPTELVIQESPEMSLNWPDNSWGGRPEAERIASVVAILNAAYQHGVGTIVDRTIPGIGRNVPRMKTIAQQTKLNIIVTTGWYTLYELPYYFGYREATPKEYPKGDMSLADFMVRDIEKGIMNTGVRAAAIKVVSDKYGIEQTPDVRKVFKASSLAHRRTGAPIVTHTVGIASAQQQQKVFAEDGVDLARVVLGHVDRTPPDVNLGEFERALEKGSFLSFDGWDNGGENILDQASGKLNLERVASLVRKKYTNQILLSSGWPIAFNDVFPPNFRGGSGPDKAYMTVNDFVIPGLKSLGVSDKDITQMTHQNPQRMLSTLAKGGY
ncbi:MAG TPA: hypothetical protein VJS42_21920 [Steroidobacteraceae bacterium]|nr:hypothetical protein [Steroidobacteraceae bacterium]